ncbi:MAG TPA: hypothetical protein VK043_07425 [Burkholderiales bacterium]|nr:hypothetical protein [Burkholderiales bacterium]
MRRSIALAALAGTLLVGCAGFPPPREEGTETAIQEALQALRLPRSEQAAALGRAQERFVQRPSPDNRVRLATLLATLPPPIGDDARAAKLLEPLASAEGGPHARYAALLAEQIARRRRLVQETERLDRELERATREREKLERDYAVAQKEHEKREEAMRQQIEALRSIERGILEREERLRRRPR